LANGSDKAVSLTYSGVGVLYSQDPSQNSFNQNASLMGSYCTGKTQVNLSAAFQSGLGANRDVGGLTRFTQTATTLAVSYQYSEKTTFQVGASQNGSLFQSANSDQTYLFNEKIRYRISPKLHVGLTASEGYNTLQNSPSQTPVILGGTLSYQYSDKLQLASMLGCQGVAFSSGLNPLVSPVFSLAANYYPFGNSASKPDTTEMALVAYRNINNSASINANDFVATGITGGVNQIINHHWFTGLALGWENDGYVPTSNGASSGRTDQYVFARPTVGYMFLSRLRIDLFYLYQQNLSTLGSKQWRNNQLGIQFIGTF
jgi:hypothetical protein